LPILEANSVRLLCRLLGIRDDPRQGPVRRRLWEAAAALLPVKHVGQFNQALMELGALVCTPSKPRCAACPVRRACRARHASAQEEIPVRAPAPPNVNVREVALVLRRGREAFLVRRPATGRWANLWEFPHTPLAATETHAQAGARLLAELGFRADLGDEIVTLKHSVTRFRITMVCLEARRPQGRLRTQSYARGRWLTPEELGRVPVSAPQRRLAGIVGGGRRQN
jgi:A/G-specific adenine glycosylase